MRQLVKLVIFLLFIGLIASLYYFYESDQQASPINYVTTEINRGKVTEAVSATGTLNPVTTVQIGSQISGIIENLNVNFNSIIKKGDLIANIESSLLKAQVAQAKANLQSANAALEKTKLSIRDTQRTVDRLKSLYAEKAITKSDLDAAQYLHDAADVEKKVKEAAISQAKAALEQANVNLRHTRIYAPIDGVVISRDVDVGQTVAASLQAPTLFTIAKDLTEMQIEAEVDEAYIGKIEQGQSVIFSVFAYPKRKFKGTVTQVRLNPKVETSVVKYNCIIQVKNIDMALKPGMTATVSIETQHKNDVFFVPGSALRYVPQWPDQKLATLRDSLEKGEAIIWQLDNNELAPLKVRRGLIGESGTEVISEKIQEGMNIVIPSKNDQSRPKRRRKISLF